MPDALWSDVHMVPLVLHMQGLPRLQRLDCGGALLKREAVLRLQAAGRLQDLRASRVVQPAMQACPLLEVNRLPASTRTIGWADTRVALQLLQGCDTFCTSRLALTAASSTLSL